MEIFTYGPDDESYAIECARAWNKPLAWAKTFVECWKLLIQLDADHDAVADRMVSELRVRRRLLKNLLWEAYNERRERREMTRMTIPEVMTYMYAKERLLKRNLSPEELWDELNRLSDERQAAREAHPKGDT